MSELYPFQLAGVNWLVKTLSTRKAALLADEPGLGKTVQAIIAAKRQLDRCRVVHLPCCQC